MGNIISGDTEITYIINEFNEKLDNVFSLLIDIKKYIILDKIPEQEKTNITNINIVMKNIDNEGFIWDDYEVRNIKNDNSQST
jgi:hypothetical protein